MEEGRISLSKRELKRILVLERVASGSMSCSEAALSLGLTPRQVRRLREKYATEGAKGLIHGNRGRKPSHALSEELRSLVAKLYEEKYSDSNFTHCGELLAEHEGIVLSTSSVARILQLEGHKSKRGHKRRPRRHRSRERRTQSGMLWQTDATPYAWLGGEAGSFALHAAIDDATGTVVGAVFMPNECADGYVRVMCEGIERYGVPLGLYSDRHAIFRSPKEKLTLAQELDGEQVPLSNFGKALAELHIEHITASTPQAKGRIERLWETLQDRLPVELRLLGVRCIGEANKVLPGLIAKHNEKYSVSSAEAATAYVPLDPKVRLEHVFALRETRKVSGGGSISYKGSSYVSADPGDVFEARTAVEVRETRSGDILIWHEGHAVALRKLEKEAHSLPEKEKRGEPREAYKPQEDHPWRASYKTMRHAGSRSNANAVAVR